MKGDSAGFRPPHRENQITVADMADMRQQGYDDGFSEGKSDGYTEGLAEGRASMQQQLEIELTKIRQLIQAMQQPFQGFRAELVLELKALTRDICENFLRYTLEDAVLLEALVEAAVLQLLPTEHQIVVHVNAHNSEVICKALENHLEAKAWRVQLNAKLSDGNVFLESGYSRVKIDMNQILSEYLEQMVQPASAEPNGAAPKTAGE